MIDANQNSFVRTKPIQKQNKETVMVSKKTSTSQKKKVEKKKKIEKKKPEKEKTEKKTEKKKTSARTTANKGLVPVNYSVYIPRVAKDMFEVIEEHNKREGIEYHRPRYSRDSINYMNVILNYICGSIAKSADDSNRMSTRPAKSVPVSAAKDAARKVAREHGISDQDINTYMQFADEHLAEFDKYVQREKTERENNKKK